MILTPDDVRNPPCGSNCPFVRDCHECRFKSGSYGAHDEQPTPRTRRKEARDGSQ